MCAKMLFEMMSNWGNWWGSGMMGSWGWPFAFFGGTLFIAALAAGILWLWMLIDCLQKQDKEFPTKGANDKLIWVIVLLLGNIAGAVLYYLMVKAKK